MDELEHVRKEARARSETYPNLVTFMEYGGAVKGNVHDGEVAPVGQRWRCSLALEMEHRRMRGFSGKREAREFLKRQNCRSEEDMQYL